MDYINFTPEKFKAFKKIYEQSVKEKKETFFFEDKEVLVAYAKYVIEYLEPKFSTKK